jgi:hypothetical protein
VEIKDAALFQQLSVLLLSAFYTNSERRVKERRRQIF